ncbi:hypothetical protein ACIBF5_00150 [Micromonospora sp. NPDC050417]|uniref:hypothetical protein n=1 Tax=Micromonospora sp. NPDC050417 TaxID=3364280 RepID=UPI00378DF308
MSRTIWAGLVGLTALVLLTVAGSVNADKDALVIPGPAPCSAESQPAPAAQSWIQRPKDYTRADLVAESAVVVRAAATGAIRKTRHVRGTGPVQEDLSLPYTLTTLRVLEVLWAAPGKRTTLTGVMRAGQVRPGGVMRIAQFADPVAPDPEMSPLLAPKCEYLIYASPPSFEQDATGLGLVWHITGGQGVYRLDATPTGTARYVFAGAGNPPLPKVLDVTAVQSRAFLAV